MILGSLFKSNIALSNILNTVHACAVLCNNLESLTIFLKWSVVFKTFKVLL